MRQDAQSEKSEGLITILSRHASDQFRFMVLSRQPNAFWPSCPAILSHSNGYLLTCRSLAASTNGDRGAILGAERSRGGHLAGQRNDTSGHQQTTKGYWRS